MLPVVGSSAIATWSSAFVRFIGCGLPVFAWLGGFTLALPDGGILNHRSSSFSESSFRCTVARMDIEGVDVVTNVAVLARFGHALSDETRTRILLELKTAPRYPSDLAETLAVTRQKLSNHLACLRGCGLVVAVPEGRRTRYELADAHIGRALDDLLGVVLAVDPSYCPDSESEGCC